MPQYTINLKAGKATRQSFSAARFLNIMDLGGADTVDVAIELDGYAKETIEGMKAGDQFQTPGFTSGSFTAAVDCTIRVVATMANIRLNNSEGASVNATIVGPNPVPVDVRRGDAPGNPFYVAGISAADTPAAALVNGPAAVAVGGAAAVLVAPAVANRLELRFGNLGTDPVALGAVGLTWADRCIVLQPGDTWVEQKGASMAWYAITDAGKAGSVTRQELTS